MNIVNPCKLPWCGYIGIPAIKPKDRVEHFKFPFPINSAPPQFHIPIHRLPPSVWVFLVCRAIWTLPHIPIQRCSCPSIPIQRGFLPPSKPHQRVSCLPPGLLACRAPQLLPDASRARAAVAVAAYMAANTHSPTPGASLKKNNAAAPLEHSSVFATASVGRGDWASEVLQNVVGGGNEETGSVTSTQASTAPPPTLSAEEQLKVVLLQKKRLFHSNRCLELKNLPEGVTEQVNRIWRQLFPSLKIRFWVWEEKW